jgi:regulator of sigma E protease
MDGGWSFGPSAIAAFIVFIGILIFVHELGHFLAAKYFNIKVLKFSLGFGPPLVAFRKGETQYQIAAIPLGGFVKMVGDSPVDEVSPEDQPRAFTTAPIYQRVVIALAGPVFNLIFPVLCFFAYNLLGPTVTAPIVGQIEIGKPAERAGLKHGDRILSINGQRTWSFERIKDLISSRAGQDLAIVVLRDGQELELHVVPTAVKSEDLFGSPETSGRIGVTPAQEGTRVGVDDPSKNKGGFETGDLILTVGDKPVARIDELDRAIRANAGRTAEMSVARPQPLAAGDLFLADGSEPKTLSVPIPEGATGIDALGLAPSDTFLRGIRKGGAADRAGLRPNDRIVKIDGRPIALFWTFLSEIERAGKEPVKLTVRRGGEDIDLTLVSDETVRKHEVTGKERPYYDPGIGLGAMPSVETIHWSSSIPDELEKANLTIGEAFTFALHETAAVIGMTALAIYKLFAHEISADTIGGPLMLFQVAARAAQLGVFEYLKMLAMISVNLGLFNLLPIPIFDGGHLLFCAVEAVKRRPLSLRAREAASIVGLVLLIALIILALRNDLLRLGLFG